MIQQTATKAIQEVVVLSGKGGTGKTSILASFALLAHGEAEADDPPLGLPVLADGDVDAADLHLLFPPTVRHRERFVSGEVARIDERRCIGCMACVERCRFQAIQPSGAGVRVDPYACEGCGACEPVCPAQAITSEPRDCGQWFASETRAGPMIHARLTPGAENSGRLVSLVRAQAKARAEAEGRGLVLVDGPPGTGCPVIAALGGASLVVVVTEPTVSGRHDLERVLDLAKHFDVHAMVLINKWDLRPSFCDEIEAMARSRGADSLGRVPYDKAFTRAQREGLAVVEVESPARVAVEACWRRLRATIDKAREA